LPGTEEQRAVHELRCVLIVEVTMEEADGRKKREQPLEMWEYADGEWYWGCMGSESLGRCPGHR
jgi:hypothetical protein